VDGDGTRWSFSYDSLQIVEFLFFFSLGSKTDFFFSSGVDGAPLWIDWNTKNSR
jgi:hypothetical protein